MRVVSIIYLFFPFFALNGQVSVEGYVYESGNRGFISGASVSIGNEEGTKVYANALTNADGIYHFEINTNGKYLIHIEKAPFFAHREVIEVYSSQSSIVYLKHEITRNPGYRFEITLAEKDRDVDTITHGLRGTLIEVYNNTTKKEELVISDLQDPEFNVDFIKGNHYTILVRKEGFISKRMEAYVDVEGCILCFEGVGEVTPGVIDNLTESNTTGVLLANVELDRYFEGKVIGMNDIYYKSGKYGITKNGALELNKIAGFLKDNPELSIELGSHTDSNGRAKYNLTLSEKRAKAAVKYLVEKKGVRKDKIIAMGYGESQLTNKCRNGVKCSELEHAVNRRTELKVLSSSQRKELRSLRQMKTEELFDEILLDLSAEGQIIVDSDKTIEEVIVEKEKLNKSPNKPPQSQGRTNSPLLEKSKDITPNTIETEEHSDHVTDTNDSFDPMAEGDISIGKSSQKIDAKLIPSGRYSPSYSGYKIVLLFNRFDLSLDHPLYSKFGDLDVYTTADGNKLYMVGSYKSRREANEILDKRFISSFPKAYVVGFEKGIIAD